jgi:PAS domain S-box-containing protein
MKVIPISGFSKAAPATAARIALAPGWRGSAIEPALTRFASELSPASGQEFFELLVEFVAECLGFEAVVVGELTVEGGERFLAVAEFPPDGTRAVFATHCDRLAAGEVIESDESTPGNYVDIPLMGSDGRAIGLICGFGYEGTLDRRTTRMLFRMVAHRAAAELERLRAQRELRRRDALFIGLTTEAHDVVAVIDDRGALTAVSPAIERVLGRRPVDCVGLPVTELVHPLDRSSIEALIRIPNANGYSAEARLHHQNGTWVTMAVTLAEHEDHDGRRFKVVSARDLTDQRRLEDRLRQSQKTEIIGRLASGIAHDFGNILMVVGSHADIMRLRTTADDPRHADVDAIQAAVTRGADLARQLLAFSRHREFEIKRMDINASIEQLATLLRRLVGSSIRLETVLSPEARFIAADATQIEQIVLNLTLNARDAMPNGGTITFATAPAGPAGPEGPPSKTAPLPAAVAAAPADYVCFSVIDTGCGIPDDVKPRIFEPQFTTKQDGAGSGMGLANVLDIVTRHGGAIDVESRDGKGATFRVYLPKNAGVARRADASTS